MADTIKLPQVLKHLRGNCCHNYLSVQKLRQGLLQISHGLYKTQLLLQFATAVILKYKMGQALLKINTDYYKTQNMIR